MSGSIILHGESQTLRTITPPSAPWLVVTPGGDVAFFVGTDELYRCRFTDAVEALGRLVAQVVEERDRQ